MHGEHEAETGESTKKRKRERGRRSAARREVEQGEEKETARGYRRYGRGGRRSNEPTSHGVVSTRAPLPLFSFSSPLPTRPPPSPSSFFHHRSLHLFLRSSLLVPPAEPQVSLAPSLLFPRLYIIHISTLVFGRLCGSTIIHTLVSSSRCVCARVGARV